MPHDHSATAPTPLKPTWLLLIALASGSAATFGLAVIFAVGDPVTLWFGIPLLIGVCVRLRGGMVTLAMLAGFAGELAATTMMGLRPGLALQLALLNLLQVAASVLLLARLGVTPPHIPRFANLSLALLVVAFLLPAANALGVATLTGGLVDDWPRRFFGWWTSNLVSVLAGLSVMLSYVPGATRAHGGSRRELVLLVALSGVVAVVAMETLDQPFVMIAIPLLLTAFRTSVFGTALACVLTVGVVVTLRLSGAQGWMTSAPLARLDVAETYFYAAVTIVLPLYVSLVLARARSAERLRERAQHRLQEIADSLPVLVGYVDRDGRYRFNNATYQEWFGKSPEEFFGRTPREMLSANSSSTDLDLLTPRIQRCLAGETVRFEGTMPLLARYVETLFKPDVEDGEVVGMFVMVSDITQRKAYEEALFREKERAEIALNSICDGVATVDVDGRVRYLNPTARTLSGWSLERALGLPVEKVLPLVDSRSGEPTANPLREAMAENRTMALATEVDLVRRDGHRMAVEDRAAPMHDGDGRVTGGVIVLHDVSKTRDLAQRMAHLARHDYLTDLPNRVLLTERLEQALHLAERGGRWLALMFLDMDGFKAVNDELGHAAGDELLRQVARRLSSLMRRSDTVCRQGGDEFIVLMPEIRSDQDAAIVARKLLRACSEPYLVEGRRLRTVFSLGIAVSPRHGADAETLMRNADTAMYRAKMDGGGRYRFHDGDAAAAPGPQR